MMAETTSGDAIPNTTTTLPDSGPYVRILNMAEGRRNQLLSWLDERCIYIPQLDPSPPPEDLFSPTPESRWREPIPIPIEYARACNGGSTDAWLVILRDVVRPFVVVRENSPAADYMVRYRLLQQVPVCAVPVMEKHREPPEDDSFATVTGGPSIDPFPASICITNDMRAQQDVREVILGLRRVVFTVEPYPEDGGGGRPPFDYAEDGIDPDAYDAEDEDSGADEGWYYQSEEGLLHMIDVELQTLEDIMEEDAHWVVPLVRTELWRIYQERQIGPHFVGGMQMEPDLGPGVAPEECRDGADPLGLEDKDGIVYTNMSERCYDDDKRIYSPYEDPGALLYENAFSDEDENGESAKRSEYERRRREEQKRLRENLQRGFQTFLSYLHIANPPSPRTTTSTVPIAGDGDPIERYADIDPENGSGAVRNSDEALEGGAIEREGGEEHDREREVTQKSVRFLDPNCIQRSVTETEKQMIEGRWCLLTLHEYQAWRCEAQSPIIEGSILNALSMMALSTPPTNSARASPSQYLHPTWLTNPLEDQASSASQRARALSESIREAKPALVAMADAYERFVSVATDAAALSSDQCPERGDGTMVVNATLWKKVCSTAREAIAAHQRCFMEAAENREQYQEKQNQNTTPSPLRDPAQNNGAVGVTQHQHQ